MDFENRTIKNHAPSPDNKVCDPNRCHGESGFNTVNGEGLENANFFPMEGKKFQRPDYSTRDLPNGCYSKEQY